MINKIAPKVNPALERKGYPSMSIEIQHKINYLDKIEPSSFSPTILWEKAPLKK
jgi:hypothetical protein